MKQVENDTQTPNLDTKIHGMVLEQKCREETDQMYLCMQNYPKLMKRFQENRKNKTTFI